MASKKSYGYIYDKAGNLKEVSAPERANGTKVRKRTKTKTGALHDSVGFAASKSK